ncbi:MAG TPA: histidine phosphatase family protein [Chlamydiales bacterium]|nr:histidine phosphatase family protein [Chlamydiales bacterium]
MTKTTFLLVRHGQTDWNVAGRSQGWSDIPLNAEGLAQATRTAQMLHQQHPQIKAIYSSNLSRAFNTAGATAGLFNLEVTQREDLREINNGSGEGMLIADKIALYKAKWDELRALYPDRRERWNHVAIEGEETLNALASRVTAELKKIASDHKGQTVAIFSHSKAIRTLIADILDQDIMEIPPLGNADVRIVHLADGVFSLDGAL